MKILIEQYAKVILAAGIAILLFGICGKLLSFAGEKILVWQQNPEVETGQAFDKIKNQEMPEVYIVDAYRLKVGEEAKVSEVLYANKRDGTNIPVTVKAIYRWDLTESMSTANDTLCIEDAGIYWLLAEVEDENGCATSIVAKIFVNER